jgi:uncharacterized protein YdcH (DUF465 family)
MSAMEDIFRHMLERFPERAGIIRSLAGTNARFKDLLGDHHEICKEISKMDLAEQEASFGTRDDLQRRRANLEEEMMLLMQDHQRV